MTAIALIALAASSVLHLAPVTEPGTRLHIIGVVQERDGRPVAGASLHVYQTDSRGRYTPDKPMDEPHARLSGRVTTGADGRFEIRTIRPGGYPTSVHLGDRDRHIPAHIHIDVTAPGHSERRAQLVFADDPLLLDPYWKNWVATLNQPVASIAAEGEGHVTHMTLSLD